MGNSTMKGMDALLKNMDLAGPNIGIAVENAVEECMAVIVELARRNLVDSKKLNWPTKENDEGAYLFRSMESGSLYNSFRTELNRVGNSIVSGLVTNDDKTAIWLEYGTRFHNIPPKKTWLHYFATEDLEIFSKEEDVSGIQETRFMRDAIDKSEEVCRKIFKNNLNLKEIFSGRPIAIKGVALGAVLVEEV